MLKLSKTGWLVVGIGVLFIAFATLGMAYSQNSREQGRLNQELGQAQLLMKKTASNYTQEKSGLENTMLKARQELGTLKSVLSSSRESIEASDNLFRIAETCRVRIVDVSSAPPARESLIGTPFSALTLSVRLLGQRSDILQFISTWTEQNTTGLVKSVAIARPREPLSDNTTGSGTVSDNFTTSDNVTYYVTIPDWTSEPGTMVANIVLVVYTYRGS